MSDARWGDPREYRERGFADERLRVYDERDRDNYDPRDGLTRDLDLPRGEERELVIDRDRVYELNGEDSRTPAAVGSFRVVPEQDLDTCQDTLGHLRDEGLVETVGLGSNERGLVLTKEGRDLLDSPRWTEMARPHRRSTPASAALGRSTTIRISTRRIDKRKRVSEMSIRTPKFAVSSSSHQTRTRSARARLPRPPQASLRGDRASGRLQSPSAIDRKDGGEGDDSRRRAERAPLLVVEPPG